MNELEHLIHHAGVHLYQHHKTEIQATAGVAGTALLAFAKTAIIPAAIAATPYVIAGAAISATGYGAYKFLKWTLD